MKGNINKLECMVLIFYPGNAINGQSNSRLTYRREGLENLGVSKKRVRWGC